MGVIQDLMAKRAAKKFWRSPSGQALHEHTQKFFYTTSNLRHLSNDLKQEIIQNFISRV